MNRLSVILNKILVMGGTGVGGSAGALEGGRGYFIRQYILYNRGSGWARIKRDGLHGGL